MIAVVSRVSSAAVTVDGRETGRIGEGLLVLLGVEKGDSDGDLEYIERKVAGLRIFDNGGKMDLSVIDTKGEILVVSQFTLSGDARKGKRPDFAGAADPESARAMYERCIGDFSAMGIRTAEGEFGAMMKVESLGDGPVTILLNSKKIY